MKVENRIMFLNSTVKIQLLRNGFDLEKNQKDCVKCEQASSFSFFRQYRCLFSKCCVATLHLFLDYRHHFLRETCGNLTVVKKSRPCGLCSEKMLKCLRNSITLG